MRKSLKKHLSSGSAWKKVGQAIEFIMKIFKGRKDVWKGQSLEGKEIIYQGDIKWNNQTK